MLCSGTPQFLPKWPWYRRDYSTHITSKSKVEGGKRLCTRKRILSWGSSVASSIPIGIARRRWTLFTSNGKRQYRAQSETDNSRALGPFVRVDRADFINLRHGGRWEFFLVACFYHQYHQSQIRGLEYTWCCILITYKRSGNEALYLAMSTSRI